MPSRFLLIIVLAILSTLCGAGCAYEQPGFAPQTTDVAVDFDQPDSFDIYVDATGPNGFYAQVEHAAMYTRREDYERDAPAIHARAAATGLPIRLVFGPEMAQTAGLAPQWSRRIDAWGYVVTFSSPEPKYVSGCVRQNAYAANLRIHRFQRGVDVRGTPLRDYHLAAYADQRSRKWCVGLVETERGSPNWCNCPGDTLRDAVSDLRQNVQQGLQDSGLSMGQAAALTAALAPLIIIAFAPVGL